MVLRAVDWTFRHTLCSVPFGVALLVLIAGYIAIGSGMASVREYFELDELGFFNAWPLKVMMFLLVVTLITVTIQRIPFTPPRYGVWMVHVGIITLIAGGAWHYSRKVEGSALIPVGGAVNRFYDRWERALYLQAGGFVTRVPLPSLPRFHSYADELKNADYLDRDDLKNLSPLLGKASTTGGPVVPAPAAEVLGLKELKLSVTGYWPYADIRTRLVQSDASSDIGFTVRTPEHGELAAAEHVLLGASLRNRQFDFGPVEFEHRPAPDRAAVDAAIEASKKLHSLTVKVGNVEKALNPQVGQTIPLEGTGYTLRIESFEPNFPAMDGSRVQVLTMMVQAPTQKFRRQVISGRPKPTDWKLGDAGAGPMGKRQTDPLDTDLQTTYTFADEQSLMSKDALAKYTIFTLPNESKATVVGVAVNEPPTTQTMDGRVASLSVPHPLSGEQMLAASSTGQPPHSHDDVVEFTRVDRAVIENVVEETPKPRRNKDEGEAGVKQVVRVRAEGRDGDDKPFSIETLAPYSQRPFEAPWQGGLLNIPGMAAVAQVQLGNNFRPLPARIKLEKFEAEAYAGLEASVAPMLRDFRSTITITDLKSGQSVTDVVYLNSPVKYDNAPPMVSMLTGKEWIFFQSQWDPEGQRWTVLGVGNRPGVTAMTVGCVLIIVGIFYAFYIKPMIIKRMKQKALAAVQNKNGSEPKPPKSGQRNRAAVAAR